MKFTPEFIAEQRERLQLHPKFGRAVATNIMWSAALDEIERLWAALASVANFGGAHIEVGEGSGKTLVWDEPSYGQTNIAIEALLKGGGDE